MQTEISSFLCLSSSLQHDTPILFSSVLDNYSYPPHSFSLHHFSQSSFFTLHWENERNQKRLAQTPPLPAVCSTSSLVCCPSSPLDTLFRNCIFYLRIHSSNFMLSSLQPHVLFPYQIIPFGTHTTAFHPSSKDSKLQLTSISTADSHEFRLF